MIIISHPLRNYHYKWALGALLIIAKCSLFSVEANLITCIPCCTESAFSIVQYFKLYYCHQQARTHGGLYKVWYHPPGQIKLCSDAMQRVISLYIEPSSSPRDGEAPH